MKKKMLSCLVIILLIVLVIMGCATPSPAPAPTAASTAAPANAPAPQAKGVTLKLGFDTPPTSYLGAPSKWWADEVTKRTEGRVTVQVFPTGTLCAQAKAIDYLRSGLADLYVISISVHEKFFPLCAIDNNPGCSLPATPEGTKAAAETLTAALNKYPSMAKEMEGLKLIAHIFQAPVHLLTKDRLVRVPADVKGLKIGGSGLRIPALELIGAVPVQDIPPLAYEKLQTGVTQGTLSDWAGISSYQLWEVAKYITDVDFGQCAFPLVMSTDAWNKVSASDQKILLDVGAESYKVYLATILDNEQSGQQKWLRHAGS